MVILWYFLKHMNIVLIPYYIIHLKHLPSDTITEPWYYFSIRETSLVSNPLDPIHKQHIFCLCSEHTRSVLDCDRTAALVWPLEKALWWRYADGDYRLMDDISASNVSHVSVENVSKNHQALHWDGTLTSHATPYYILHTTLTNIYTGLPPEL